jgi:serine/threonine protein kinase
MILVWQQGDSINNGRFTIEQVLGIGGFGITYKATDNARGGTLAIKTLNPTMQLRPDFQEQQVKFINEAITVKGFIHPHILKVYEVIREKELFGVVMEYINGISLSKYIEQKGQLTEELALKYIDQIGQALEEVHRNNYLHRDIKPDNILLRNNNQEAVLIDFGISREIATQNMSILLTDGYAPIEQYQRRGNFGPHTDVYALAATLYYLLTAKELRSKGEVSPLPATRRKYDQDPLPEPRSYNHNISQKVNDAILAAMKLDPEQRTKDISEFRKDLGLLTKVQTETVLIPLHPENMQRLVIDTPLESIRPTVTSIVYKKLNSLLQSQNFREADLETRNLVLKIAKREKDGWLRVEDAEEFPCKELRTIDKLWLKHSQQKFGISIQQKMYQSLWENLYQIVSQTKECDVDTWSSFGDLVGWKKSGKWIDYNHINFSLTAPSGHLPFAGIGGWGWFGVTFEVKVGLSFPNINTYVP